MIANLKMFFFWLNAACLLFTRHCFIVTIKTLIPYTYNLFSWITLYSWFALQPVSLICNLYRFSAQQQQEENIQKQNMSYHKKKTKTKKNPQKIVTVTQGKYAAGNNFMFLIAYFSIWEVPKSQEREGTRLERAWQGNTALHILFHPKVPGCGLKTWSQDKRLYVLLTWVTS